MTAEKRLKQVSGNFVQGQIDLITGNSENVLMEHDVKRISDSINEDLIKPVIDYVTECDNILLDTIQLMQNDVDQITLDVGLAKQEAQAATGATQNAQTEASNAKSEAERAHIRIDEIGGKPNLDSQTWKWLPRSFDSVSIEMTNGVSLASPTGKPRIIWTPIRQNFETGRYFVEGRFEARIKIMLMDWIQKSEGGNIAYLVGAESLASFNGRIGLSGLSNDVMKPTSIQVNAYTAKDSQMIFGVSADAAISTSQVLKLAILADIGSNRFDRYTDPVYVDIVMSFQRDGGVDFGFGQIFPELNP